jgi:hypothetical protein
MPIWRARAAQTVVLLPLLEAGTRTWKATPTIAAGDFWIAKDDGNEVAFATTPTIQNTYWVRFELSATEMTADVVTIRCKDAAGAEWDDTGETIYTTSGGSSSVVSATAALDIDYDLLASTLAPQISSLVSIAYPALTSGQLAQLVSLLDLNNSTGGYLGDIKIITDQFSFSGGYAQVKVADFAAAAITILQNAAYDGLNSASNTPGELSSVPASTVAVTKMIQWMYQAERNGGVQSATTRTRRNDAGTTTATQSVTDGGTTITVGKQT